MSLDRPVGPNPYDLLPAVGSFEVRSDDFEDGSRLAKLQSGEGGSVSPQLTWVGAPETTESFVVTCFDPDAPTASGFWHWVVLDIPGDTFALPADAGRSNDRLPAPAFHVRNDVGEFNYVGAGPPEGDREHRYYFVVHAVGAPSLGVNADTTPAMVGFNLRLKTLARAIVMGTYQR